MRVLRAGTTVQFKVSRRPALFEGRQVVCELCSELGEQTDLSSDSRDIQVFRSHLRGVGYRQVKGVGPITSLAYVLTLEDPQRFASSREVGPYLGLVPKQEDVGG
jgi:hypothetical protein